MTWPAGKRRHAVAGWERPLAALARALAERFQRGRVSRRQAALALGVADRTVRRWLSGEDVPDSAMQRAVSDLVQRWRKGQ